MGIATISGGPITTAPGAGCKLCLGLGGFSLHAAPFCLADDCYRVCLVHPAAEAAGSGYRGGDLGGDAVGGDDAAGVVGGCEGAVACRTTHLSATLYNALG
jgi:hypothetical protein